VFCYEVNTMVIRNTIAGVVAVSAGAATAGSLIGVMTALSPFFGAAAITSVLASLGGTMFAGLLTLALLSTFVSIVTFILMQIQLSWLPV